MEEAVRMANLVEPGSDRITLEDVTPLNRMCNLHNFSLETRVLDRFDQTGQ